MYDVNDEGNPYYQRILIIVTIRKDLVLVKVNSCVDEMDNKDIMLVIQAGIDIIPDLAVKVVVIDILDVLGKNFENAKVILDISLVTKTEANVPTVHDTERILILENYQIGLYSYFP